jgi:diacylglycerol kinase (ATP)
MNLLRKHHISFKHAFDGVVWAFTTQPNFRIHFLLSAIAVIGGIILRISYLEMTIICLTIVFGIGVEMLNTAIEAMTDLITIEYRKQAKIAKDVAAGMMLVMATGALFIAALIFIPRILLFIR